MHKTAAWPLALIYTALIVYASLYPFEGWRYVGIAPWSFLGAPLPRYWTGFDVAANLAGYAPLGFLLALSALRTKPRLPAVLLATVGAALLSLAMESLQTYLPKRVASNVDLALNLAGAWLGALAAFGLEKAGAIARWSRFRDRWFVAASRGALVLPLRLDARLAPGGADLPMHWGPEFVREGVNLLASRARCPDSQQPELKFSAAQIESADLPWRVSGCAYVPSAQGAALRQALQALMPQAGYAQCLAAPEPPPGQLGWALEAAFAEPPPAAWIAELSAALALQTGAVHRYQDRGRGRLRLLRLQDDGEALQALLRVGAHDEAAWLQALWLGQQPARLLGRWLLGPGNPPADALAPPPAPQVCLCFGVREDAIRGCLRRRRSGPSDPSEPAGLEGLQAELKCGTQCGSCLPTLRRIAKEVAQEGA